MTSPSLRNGSVAVKNGLIAAVGKQDDIRKAFGDADEISHTGALMPALVNAHMHLELSHFAGIRQPGGEGVCQWIDDLLDARAECRLGEVEKKQLRERILAQQHQAGVVLIGDIGNEPFRTDIKDNEYPRIYHFQEFLAPTKASAKEIIKVVADLPDAVSATAHACYSTLPELISILKKRARRLCRVFSIHVAESAEEVRFLQSHSGPFRDFLDRRGAWDDSFSAAIKNPEGVVAYLQSLGVLDSKTLCVHCVHIKETEIKMLLTSRSHICLCPGSNRFLRVGTAPLEMMLEGGILPAIGTDSIASNEQLDVWREMQILREEHPTVEPKIILAMATLGGATALDCERSFGCLAPGRKAVFLRVEPEQKSCVDIEQDLVDLLTRGGRPRNLEWIGY